MVVICAPVFVSCAKDEIPASPVLEAEPISKDEPKLESKQLQLTEEEIGSIPVIKIETQNGVLPYDKENYINCSFKIENCENEEDNFEVSMKENWKDKDSVGIRLRGNSTLELGLQLGKSPYRIKFDKKKSLFGLEANKSWVLLADYIDQSSIRNYTAFHLASLIAKGYEENGTSWFVPTAHHVVLYVNGQCKGLYLLCEQIDEKVGRTAVETQNDLNPELNEIAFLVEMDHLALDEGKYGIKTYQVEGMPQPIEIKWPEFEEENNPEFNLIVEYLETVFYLLENGGTKVVSFSENPVALDDLIEEQTFIDWYLVNEIMMNMDSYWKSVYFYKSKDGKLKMGPVWDFDYSMHTWLGSPNIDKTNIPYLIKDSNAIIGNWIKDDKVWNKFCERWDEIKHFVLETVQHLKTYKKEIQSIGTKQAEFYYDDESLFTDYYELARLFLLDRYTFLDSYFTERE